MTMWQKMETAPRDGTVIIVFVPEWEAFHAAAFVRERWRIAVRKDGLMEIAAPSKWKPLMLETP